VCAGGCYAAADLVIDRIDFDAAGGNHHGKWVVLGRRESEI
jgi:hypothetical protein